jgi:putative SOS response-associated peptidase YedK
MVDDSTFAFGGLWESWIGPNGEVVETCSILTTKPNTLVADVHRRTPAILRRDDYERWLDPIIKNPSAVSGCLAPFDAALMKKYPVSTRVNRAENGDHECAQEISVAATPTLF